jgi:hypothetical protein
MARAALLQDGSRLPPAQPGQGLATSGRPFTKGRIGNDIGQRRLSIDGQTLSAIGLRRRNKSSKAVSPSPLGGYSVDGGRIDGRSYASIRAGADG